ncbi:C39 family peptidase [Yoonia sp. SDW83-1]|uniref:C39 family peptidase n=1 Tax=Yoonia sp. SDW83-1 TaxID=3366945 RepID=UPI00398C3C73
MSDTTASGAGNACGALWSRLTAAVQRYAVPVPGGDTQVEQAATDAANADDAAVETSVATCPAPCVVTITTRAGDIPISGVIVKSDGRRVGISDANGVVRGDLSACGGTTTLTAIYENEGARVKREVFTLELSGIDISAGSATGGQARNYISKVQDVFGDGSPSFPGDLDFDDNYDGADLVSVGPPPGMDSGSAVLISAKMATLSIEVPYRNQNDGTETIGGVGQNGFELCMPTSGEMMAGYWGIEHVADDDTRRALTRLDIMTEARAQNSSLSLFNFPRPWQDWANYRAAMTVLVDASHPDAYSVSNGPSGGGSERIPSAYADGLTDLLESGCPVVTSTHATNSGHVMCVVGGVVDHADETQWLIINDPNGSLASSSSIYGEMNIGAPVGLRGSSTAAVMNSAADVRAVQQSLARLGHYTGEIGAAVDGADPNDPTVVAIRAMQGNGGDGRVDPNGRTERRINSQVANGSRSSYSRAENESNGANGDRGRHVYYSSSTEAAPGRFLLKGEAWTCVIEPDTALTTAQISARLNAGITT